MAHNFTRPGLPYANQSLANDDRFQVITRSLNAPPTDVMLDSELNALTDSLNILDADIGSIVAGAIPGINDPNNANFVLSTDGAGHAPWKLIDDTNVEVGSVSGNKLIDSSVTAQQLQNGTITLVKMAPVSVGTTNLVDGSVTTPKLANDAVTTIKLLDANVTTAKLEDNSVTTIKISDANVTTAKIADANITTAKILDANVTTAKIADANVTAAKIANNTITATQIDPTLLTGAAVKADQITGTSIVTFTNPAVQQFHNSAAKAWVRFLGADGTIRSSYNVASVVKNSTGNYTITFIVPFADALYSCFPSTEQQVGISNYSTVIRDFRTLTTTQSRLQTYDSIISVFDADVVNAHFFGLQ